MTSEKIPLWRDERILRVIGQIIVLLIVLGFFLYFWQNLSYNIRRLGLDLSFNFLFDPNRPASFRIGDSLIPYQATDSFRRALGVGLLNSLRVMISGIIGATVLGISVGMARLSDNWLIRHLSLIYVNILRNTPLLLQLFFWYFAVFLKLPQISAPVVIFKHIFLSNQGIYLPWPNFTLKTALSLLLILLLGVSSFLVWHKSREIRLETGRSTRWDTFILSLMAIAMLVTFIEGISWQFPVYEATAGSLKGGLSFSPEFSTLLVGLTVYTSAFIAEVVRAGIQSVSLGQWEAAKALGLPSGLILGRVIFPQALRVIIPPLTSEYLNLAKNSSLAIAIGYSDLYAVSSTIANKTGQAVQMLVVVMLAYLSFNLIIATIMNRLNQAVQIKER